MKIFHLKDFLFWLWREIKVVFVENARMIITIKIKRYIISISIFLYYYK